MPAVKTATFESTNLVCGLYNALEGKLYLQFHNGRIYEYDDVSPATWWDLVIADSHGSHFHSEIRGQYNSQELTIME